MVSLGLSRLLEHNKIRVGMGEMNFFDFGSYEPNIE
jgi:hypothetical protein